MDLAVSESSDDLFKSIHRVVDKLERRLAEHARRNAKECRHPHAIDLPVSFPKTIFP